MFLLQLILTLFVVYFNELWADPIVEYKQGANGRAQSVHAIIYAKDLRKGEPTSVDKNLAANIRAMGKPGDNCGHIVARVLGGRMKAYNLFPQNAGVNSGEFRENVESHMQYFLERDENGRHSVDYQADLVYNGRDDTRPTMLKFEIKFQKDNKLVPVSQIPRSKKHQVPSNPYRGVIQNP